jgi:hypothetical protein
LISDEKVGVVSHLKPLPKDPLSKLQAYYHLSFGWKEHPRELEEDNAYLVMTHYIVLRRKGIANPANRIASLVVATNSPYTRRAWVSIIGNEGESTWKLVTDDRRKKPESDWIKRRFRHIKDGELIYFVYRSRIPKGMKVEPVELGGNEWDR